MIREQYSLIQSSRKALFHYCDTVSQQHLVLAHPAFGTKSIRDLLVHIANAYGFWIGTFGLRKPSPSPVDTPESMEEIRNIYSGVDHLMLEFIDAYGPSWGQMINGRASQNRVEMNVSVLKLFTHVTTHEFHHKGQILTISRLHGYTPADTDVIRF